MLRRLSIRDFVLIRGLDLELGAGLAVFTGETGAGKSILLDALGLALGARAAAGMVARGRERATVTAVFDPPRSDPLHALLAEHGLEAEDALLLRRTLGADGRSRGFVNDAPVGVALLRRIGGALVESEGQAEPGGLLDPANHLAMLDDFAGHGPARARLAAAYAAWRDARAAESAAESARQAARREEETLRHAVAELEALAPEAGEEARCAAARARLLNGQKIAEALEAARAELVTGSVATRLRAAQGAVARGAPPAGGALDALAGALERAAIEAEEAESALAAAAHGLDTDSGRLETVEARLFALRDAARKHGTEPDSLGTLLARLRADLDLADESGERLAALRRATCAAHRAYRETAAALSQARQDAARALDDAVAKELEPLKLGHARFATALDSSDDDATATGIDRCRFMLATDPAAAPAPLAKIASGGERARLLLALRVCLARAAGLSTLVFDEIDRGIGGAVASAVGERLAKLARDVQVLVVTHSPQVAARGDHHYRVARSAGEGGAATEVASTEVGLLADAARREEIARMLSGARITREARAAARSLLRAG